ncbi:Hypothetical protein PHPALM_11991 [Phytophthora palmivora]|uniref:Uncharacterized protein n=1 Tax=Phytophthora palmivora TaxID=4796 RepID=A0A2P4Y0W6_9STRA|nr:Hypothetical protein PHPALM_11991 [Phytophthora palmivora]
MLPFFFANYILYHTGKRSEYKLSSVQREQILAYLSNFICSSTASGYETDRETLKTYCMMQKKLPIYAYYENLGLMPQHLGEFCKHEHVASFIIAM